MPTLKVIQLPSPTTGMSSPVEGMVLVSGLEIGSADTRDELNPVTLATAAAPTPWRTVLRPINIVPCPLSILLFASCPQDYGDDLKCLSERLLGIWAPNLRSTIP
ncbi:protein of unknown function [Candidatus Filomicrobium marinum]|nr:protein of unknown function [Candidatus Filomicrobium marinum]